MTTTKPLHAALSKLGDTRRGERTRIWLEGSKLTSAGFRKGFRYARYEEGDKLVIVLSGTGSLKVAGTSDRPIIDMTGRFVADLFATAGCTHVAVEYYPGQIVVRQA